MKNWHREDIFAALVRHGWRGPVAEAPDSYHVGEAYAFLTSKHILQLRLVADLGTGLKGSESIEEAVAIREDGTRAELWLARRRDSKWQKDLALWASQVSVRND